MGYQVFLRIIRCIKLNGLKFRMWFKYGLKAQKLLAQGVWSLHAKLELFSSYNLPPKLRFFLETTKKSASYLDINYNQSSPGGPIPQNMAMALKQH